MAAESDETDNQPVKQDRELSQDVCTTNKVQEQGGSYTVAIPKQSAHDLGIGKGDSLLFTGQEGEERLEVQTTESFLSSRTGDR